MRSLLSSSIRPRIGCLNSKTTKSVPSSTRKSISAPNRRKLSFNDAFTLLLAPILGTALIADTTWKDKKRQDWNTRIAEVLDDLAEIQERELQAWHNVQTRSVNNGVLQQRRCFSSQALPFRQRDGKSGSTQCQENLESPQIVRRVGGRRVALQQGRSHADQRTTSSDVYEGFIASRMAVEMLLYLRNNRMTYDRSQDVLGLQVTNTPQSTDELLKQLHDTEDKIRELQNCLPPRTLTMDNEIDDAQKDLNRYVRDIAQKYKTGRIDTATLVQGYAEAVLRLRRYPSLPSYGRFLEALSMRSQSVDLPGIVMKAMRTTKQLLGTRALWAMIWQYGNAKNSGKLELFLQVLTKLHSGPSLVQPWEQVWVGRTRVAVPVDRNSSLLNILVKVALQCKMIHKAEAWAILLCQPDIYPTRFSFVFRNFIGHCSDEGDWYLGRQWIQGAIMWASVVEGESPQSLPRTVYRMLDLCVVCDQKELYEEILQAAVMSGIELPPLDQERAISIRRRGQSLRQDWANRLREVHKNPNPQPARCFQEYLARNSPSLKPFVGITDQAQLRLLMKEHESTYDSEFDVSTTLSPQRVLHTSRENSLQCEAQRAVAQPSSHMTTPKDTRADLAQDVHQQQPNHLSRLHVITDARSKADLPMIREHTYTTNFLERTTHDGKTPTTQTNTTTIRKQGPVPPATNSKFNSVSQSDNHNGVQSTNLYRKVDILLHKMRLRNDESLEKHRNNTDSRTTHQDLGFAKTRMVHKEMSETQRVSM